MVICVTNRKICCEGFYDRIEKIAKQKPYAIILREKDLSAEEYEKTALRVKEICKSYDTQFIVNSFYRTAEKIGVRSVHLPFPVFKTFKRTDFFEKVGTSVHSVEDALQAEENGADYIICGHIFQTDCKKGLEPRGTDFVKSVKGAVEIPVFAIGGIDENNGLEVIKAGADGVCVMSTLMVCDNKRIKRICNL
jgi:thiamine-phosphate pyrophosphorylase